MNEPFIVRTILPPTRWKTMAMDSLADGTTAQPTNGTGVRSKASSPADTNTKLASITPAQKALAIAHLVEDALLAGHVKNYSDAARRLGFTKPRLHDYMALLVLSPRVVEAVLFGEIDQSVRDLTWLVRTDSWPEHERLLKTTGETTPPERPAT